MLSCVSNEHRRMARQLQELLICCICDDRKPGQEKQSNMMPMLSLPIVLFGWRPLMLESQEVDSISQKLIVTVRFGAASAEQSCEFRRIVSTIRAEVQALLEKKGHVMGAFTRHSKTGHGHVSAVRCLHSLSHAMSTNTLVRHSSIGQTQPQSSSLHHKSGEVKIVT